MMGTMHASSVVAGNGSLVAPEHTTVSSTLVTVSAVFTVSTVEAAITLNA
jgi:hypothetical protein